MQDTSNSRARLATGPKIISEYFPGLLHYDVRAYRHKLDEKDISGIIQKIKDDIQLTAPYINAELGLTGVQYRSYNDIKLRANELLEQLNLELASKERLEL